MAFQKHCAAQRTFATQLHAATYPALRWGWFACTPRAPLTCCCYKPHTKWAFESVHVRLVHAPTLKCMCFFMNKNDLKAIINVNHKKLFIFAALMLPTVNYFILTNIKELRHISRLTFVKKMKSYFSLVFFNDKLVHLVLWGTHVTVGFLLRAEQKILINHF